MKKLFGLLCTLAALAAAILGIAALCGEAAGPAYGTIYDDADPDTADED